MEKKGYIYLITNIITNEKYVGQTKSSIYVRFGQHARDYKRHPERKLYKNMTLYGINNFIPSILEECPVTQLDEREKYWITKLDTYKNGLNDTIGGSGKAKITANIEEDIIYIFQETNSYQKIHEKYELDSSTIKGILTKNGILTNAQEITCAQFGNIVQRIDKNTGEILEEYPSQVQAGLWLKEHGLSNIKDKTKLSYAIGRACKEHRCVGGFYWNCKENKQHGSSLDIPITRIELKNKIRLISFTALGREYRVSDNTIRRWCKHYNLPSTKKEITSISNEDWEKI